MFLGVGVGDCLEPWRSLELLIQLLPGQGQRLCKDP